MPATELIFGPNGSWTRAWEHDPNSGQRYTPALVDIAKCILELEAAIAPAPPDLIEKAVTLFVGGFPSGKPADPVTYLNACELMIRNVGVPPDLLPRLVERVWTECKFMPAPAELSEIAMEVADTRLSKLRLLRTCAKRYGRDAWHMARMSFESRIEREAAARPLEGAFRWQIERKVQSEMEPLVENLVMAIWECWLRGDLDTANSLCERMKTDEAGADAEARALAKAYMDRPKETRFRP